MPLHGGGEANEKWWRLGNHLAERMTKENVSVSTKTELGRRGEMFTRRKIITKGHGGARVMGGRELSG